jgi:hypothetical protein
MQVEFNYNSLDGLFGCKPRLDPPPFVSTANFFFAQARLNALKAHSGDSLTAVTDSDAAGVASLKGCDATG